MSNEGRGYVLRRVLRRATKYAKKLGINKPFMASLVDVVIQIMDPFYPYLHEKVNLIKEVITKEETKFLETINQGEKRFNEIANKSDMISGEDAFLLYDTYGFPYELTEEYAEELGKHVDEEGFKAAMQAQKERARASRKDIASMKGQNEAFMQFKEKSVFVGYETLSCQSKVIGVFENAVVLDKTPFYAFSGGQLCDKGTINGIEVIDVIKMPNGQHLHTLKENDLNVGDIVSSEVDENYRVLTMKNHSSAHLFQAALQQLFGHHIHQQGSQVSNTYMRFDFNNYNALTDEDIIKVEDLVNSYIKEAHPVITHILPIEEAKKLDAMALFDDKYGNLVRVVDMDVSKEFCAGTHVKNTRDIIHFEINSIESIGSGIYRCLATTGSDSHKLLLENESNLLNEIETLINKGNQIVTSAQSEGIKLSFVDDFKSKNNYGYRSILELKEHIKALSDQVKALDKKYQGLKSQNALSNLQSYENQIENNCLFVSENNPDINILKDLASALQNKYNLKVVFISSICDNKVTFIAKTDKSINASSLVKTAAQICDGNGGGKPDLAQAGGKNPAKVMDAIKAVKDLI